MTELRRIRGAQGTRGSCGVWAEWPLPSLLQLCSLCVREWNRLWGLGRPELPVVLLSDHAAWASSPHQNLFASF